MTARRWAIAGSIVALTAAWAALGATEAPEPSSTPEGSPVAASTTGQRLERGPRPPAPRCAHPYLGAGLGDRRVYESRAGALRERVTMRCTDVRWLDEHDAYALTWHVVYESPTEGDREGDVDSRCNAERAEIPLERVPLLGSSSAQRELPRWWMPATVAQLTEHDRTVRVGARTWRRRERVVARDQRIETPAGTFTALEVQRDEEILADGERLAGTTRNWIAEGIGLIRSVRDGVPGSTELIER